MTSTSKTTHDALDIYKAPAPADLSKRTGLFQTIVWRNSTKEGRTICFSAQKKDSNEHDSLSPALVAIKKGNGSYAVYSDSSQQHQVGQLVLVRKSMSLIEYALQDSSGIQVASILYEVPSVLAAICVNPLSRSAWVAFPTAPTDPKELSPTWFQEACEASIRETGSLVGLVDSPGGIVVCQTNPPYTKSDGRLGLNFHGRGREPSNKNLQLILPRLVCKKKSPVVCQMAKWESNVYHLDFGSPFTPLTAFGFALAQVDL